MRGPKIVLDNDSLVMDTPLKFVLSVSIVVEFVTLATPNATWRQANVKLLRR